MDCRKFPSPLAGEGQGGGCDFHFRYPVLGAPSRPPGGRLAPRIAKRDRSFRREHPEGEALHHVKHGGGGHDTDHAKLLPFTIRSANAAASPV